MLVILFLGVLSSNGVLALLPVREIADIISLIMKDIPSDYLTGLFLHHMGPILLPIMMPSDKCGLILLLFLLFFEFR